MYVRIILSLVVIFGCGYAGILFGRADISRINQLDSLNAVLKALEFNISYLSIKLSDVFSEVSCEDKTVEMIFRSMAELIAENKGITVSEAWQTAARQNQKGIYLTDEDMAVMNSFICALGSGDRGSELSNIKTTRCRLEEICRGAREKAEKNSRLYKNCGFLIGAMTSLILF